MLTLLAMLWWVDRGFKIETSCEGRTEWCKTDTFCEGRTEWCRTDTFCEGLTEWCKTDTFCEALGLSGRASTGTGGGITTVTGCGCSSSPSTINGENERRKTSPNDISLYPVSSLGGFLYACFGRFARNLFLFTTKCCNRLCVYNLSGDTVCFFTYCR